MRILIALIIFCLYSSASAQRQYFLSESKDYYDAIFVEWVRTGATALGTWTRLKVVDENVEQVNYSVQAKFSRSAFSLVIGGTTVVTGELRGKGLSVTLRTPEGAFSQQIFVASSLATFNKLIARYQKGVDEIKATNARYAAVYARAEQLKDELRYKFNYAEMLYTGYLEFIVSISSFDANFFSQHEDFTRVSEAYKQFDSRFRFLEKEMPLEGFCSKKTLLSEAIKNMGLLLVDVEKTAIASQKIATERLNAFDGAISYGYKDVIQKARELDTMYKTYPQLSQDLPRDYTTLSLLDRQKKRAGEVKSKMPEAAKVLARSYGGLANITKLMMDESVKWQQQLNACP